MTRCSSGDENRELDGSGRTSISTTKFCPSCGHLIPSQKQAIIRALPSLPAGVKFDPTDQELLEHLEGKTKPMSGKLHPLVDEFIPTLQGDNGICYTHPEKLPGVEKDGQVRHFFHRPSKAYTTGTRKRRKVHTDAFGGETRWHKTGKTKPVFAEGQLRGFKKILVLYTNFGKQRKPEKTNWVMHQYHIGANAEEKEGEFVVSKVFYQTQPRTTSGTASRETAAVDSLGGDGGSAELYDDAFVSFGQQVSSDSPRLIPNFSIDSHGSSLLS